MQAVDFVLYCLGASAVLVSSAASIRLVTGGRPAPKPAKPPAPKFEAVPDPGDGLQDRLTAFQSARFASPIVQRQLSDDAGPPPRFPPVRRAPLPVPPPRRPVPPKEEDNVIPIPLKMRKNTEPPKEGA